jgi:hypothetical protein
MEVMFVTSISKSPLPKGKRYIIIVPKKFNEDVEKLLKSNVKQVKVILNTEI